MANPVQSLVGNLQAYLAAQVAGLTVLTEWPGGNVQLRMPSLTIFSGEAQFMNLTPYVIASTTPDPVTHLTTTTLIVGEYDLKLQLDLWCRNKLERETMFGLVEAAINKQVSPMGLSLQMTDYFSQWARYDIDNHQFVDDEAGAQRQEWRVKIELLANCRMVKQVTGPAMITFDNQLSTPNTI